MELLAWGDESVSDRIELAKLIQSLREELATAWHQGQQSSIGFEAGPVELEVTVQAEKTGEVKGGVRFWVVEAGASGALTDAETQRVKLTMIPRDRSDPSKALLIDGEAVPDED